MVTPQNYNCPQCGQVDRVEKVSAIVRAGTSTGFYTAPTTSGSSLMGGMSWTALSHKLTPPIEPTYEPPMSTFSFIFVFLCFSVSIIFTLILFIPNIAHSPAGFLPALIFLDALLVGGLLLFFSRVAN